MQFFSFFNFMTLLHVLVIIAVSFRVIKVRLPVAGHSSRISYRSMSRT